MSDMITALQHSRIAMAGAVLVGIIGMGACGHYLYNEYWYERAEVTAFCQPRGYIGGRLAWRGVGAVCIDKDNAEVLISEIKQSERDKSFRPRRLFFPF